jgi:hypothetical protein
MREEKSSAFSRKPLTHQRLCTKNAFSRKLLIQENAHAEEKERGEEKGREKDLRRDSLK